MKTGARTVRGLLVAGALAALLQACAFQTLDVRRPLVVAVEPTTGERFEQVVRDLGVPAEQRPKFLESMEKSRRARRLFSILRHNESRSYLSIERLATAVNDYPDNPFAWIQLGANLALDHQAVAAIDATEHGLAIITERCGDLCSEDLRNLRIVGNINLAKYYMAEDRPLEALLPVQAIRETAMTPFDRLAWLWTSADVKSRLGNREGAQADLQQATNVSAEEIEASAEIREYEYPQYFGFRRRANHHYLQAIFDFDIDDSQAAYRELTTAQSIDGKNPDIQLALANAEQRLGNYAEAIPRLRRLRKKSKREIYRAERIALNLGNALVGSSETSSDVSDLLQQAHVEYQDAQRIVEKRYGRIEKQARLARVFETGNGAFFFLDALSETPRVYADALNNDGDVCWRLAKVAESEEKRNDWLAQAEAQWRRALLYPGWADRSLALGNLTRLYAETGRLERSFEFAEASLREDPYNAVPLRVLLFTAATHPDPVEAANVAEVAGRLIIDHLEFYAPGTFDDVIMPVLKRLKELPQSPSSGRAALLLSLAGRSAEDARVALRARALFERPQHSALGLAQIALSDPGEYANVLAEILQNSEAPDSWVKRRDRAEALATRAAIAVTTGQYDSALSDLRDAVAQGYEGPLVDDLRVKISEGLSGRSGPAADSIAVLPFASIFEDGHSWVHALGSTFVAMLRAAGAPNVRRIERDLADSANWHTVSPVDVGRRLRVDAIVSGRVAIAEDRVLLDITVQSTLTGEEIYTRQVNVKPSELRAAQAEVSGGILAALRIPAGANGQETAAKMFTTKDDAYIAYLDGLDRLLARNPLNADRPESAVRHLTDAIRADPDFAHAHAALVMAYFQLANFYKPAIEVLDQARQAAKTAMTLAPDTAEVQLSHAIVKTWFDWNREEGEKSFKRAIEIDPSWPGARQAYGEFLLATGSFPEALDQKRRALQMAPLSAEAHHGVARALFFSGQYREAIAAERDALALNPQLHNSYMLMSWAYAKLNRCESALDALDRVQKITGSSPYIESQRAVFQKMMICKQPGDAQSILKGLSGNKNRYVLPLFRARIEVAMGRYSDAYAQLRQLIPMRSESVMWLEVDPWLEQVRREPGFQEILREVELERQ